MAAKPSILPDWATASSNVTTPPAGVKASGWDLNGIPVSGYFNWLGKYTRDWLEYLKDGVMSGAFTFDSTVDVSGAMTAGATTVAGFTNSKSFKNTNTITPPAFGTAQNDYAPTGHADAYHFRLQPTAVSTDLSSLVGGVDGREIVISNIEPAASANSIEFLANTGGTAANRFLLATSFTLTACQSAKFIYDGTSARWRKIG